jgi:integrase
VKARDISRPDVRALIESITDKGAPVLANRVLALVSKMFNFALVRDWRTDNPCQGVEKNPEKSLKRVLTDDEITKVWEVLEREDPFFRALFQLRFFTAARGGEIRRMRWADIDLEAGWWNLPPEFVKNERAHRLPLAWIPTPTLRPNKSLSR